MQIYVASSLNSVQTVQQVCTSIRKAGHAVPYDWSTHGRVKGNEHKMSGTALQELKGVSQADTLFVILPGGAGTHTELGYALAKGIPVYIFGEPQDFDHHSGHTTSFYFHPLVASRIVCNGKVLNAVNTVLLDIEEAKFDGREGTHVS